MSNTKDRRKKMNREYSYIKNLCVKKNFELALEECDKFVLKYPNMEKARITQAMLLRQFGRYDEALAVLNCKFFHQGDFADMEKLRIYMCQERYEDALSLKKKLENNVFLTQEEDIKEEIDNINNRLLSQMNLEQETVSTKPYQKRDMVKRFYDRYNKRTV